MKKKFIVVYDKATRDNVVAFGTAKECADYLGIKVNTIHKAIYCQKKNIEASSKYYFYVV